MENSALKIFTQEALENWPAMANTIFIHCNLISNIRESFRQQNTAVNKSNIRQLFFLKNQHEITLLVQR